MTIKQVEKQINKMETKKEKIIFLRNVIITKFSNNSMEKLFDLIDENDERGDKGLSYIMEGVK